MARALILSSYAFAKSIDNLSSDVQGFSAQDPNNNNGEKAVSDYNVRRRWVTSFNYQLPFGIAQNRWVSRLAGGWEIGSIFTVQSGLPFTPAISTDQANTGTSLRPNRLASGIPSNGTIHPGGERRPNIIRGRTSRRATGVKAHLLIRGGC